MAEWNKGRVYTRSLDLLATDEHPARYGFIEIRDDIADGWEWTIYEGHTSRVYAVADTLAQAKAAAMREAKRLGFFNQPQRTP